MLTRSAILIATIAVAACLAASACLGQSAGELSSADFESLFEEQAAEIAELRERLDRRESVFHPTVNRDQPECPAPASGDELPVQVEEPAEPSWSVVSASESETLRYYADHDGGFVFRPFDPKDSPFELKINGWIQFRHHAFARDVESWTDNAGVTRPVRDRNVFDIERARLVLSGYSLDQRLTYFLQLDGDTDGSHTVDFLDYWWGWKATDRFRLQFGKRKVTASRQWLLGARRTRFIDRPMANDFFRPDRTVGLFGTGRVGELGHYEVMVGDGYSTNNLPAAVTDNLFTFAAMGFWDPLGDFGGQIVDYDYSCDALIRLGHSFVFSPQSSDTIGIPLGEADFVRLTDGTRLTQTGALAPGVRVSDYDIYLYGLDAALKWRGWSINTEVFLRWIEELKGDGPLPVTDLFQRGFYVEGGCFLIAKRLDMNFRYSQVSGLQGDASEYAGGFNWYPLDNPKLKVSFDVTSLDGSPLQNTTSDILVGDDGVLFRTQFQADF